MATEASKFFENALKFNGNNSIKVDFTKCRNMENIYGIVSNNAEEQQRHIDQLSAQVSDSEDVVNLLDHVNWRMFIYSCKQTCSNFSFPENEFQYDCPSSACCFRGSIDDLLFDLSQYDYRIGSSDLNSLVISTWFVFFNIRPALLVGKYFCDV